MIVHLYLLSLHFLLFVHLQNTFLTMGPKKRPMSLQLNRKIIEKYDKGEDVQA